MRSTRAVLLALLGPALAGAAPAAPGNPLVAPARCVSDYLEAVAAAAPPRPPRAPAARRTGSDDPRWQRARSFLAPPRPGSAAALPPPAPWDALGPDGAFLGYELLAVRRAPLGSAVVVAAERTLASPRAEPVTTPCAYLAAPAGERWVVVARRCGEDFADDEIAAALGEPP